jgi:hypothetical protein
MLPLLKQLKEYVFLLTNKTQTTQTAQVVMKIIVNPKKILNLIVLKVKVLLRKINNLKLRN